MDRFTPRLLSLGLKGTIGKGHRSDAVKEALREFLEGQPPLLKVMLITYGSEIDAPVPKFIGAPMMSSELENLSPDDDSGEAPDKSLRGCYVGTVERRRRAY